ncbi:MAG TPA: c-type cytochrome [Phenylobacterium sp.]|nr:c-type cytochrome [Phenylobacterium sp.]
MRGLLALAMAAVALSGCATGGPAAHAPGQAAAPRLDPAAQRGHDFAQRRCAGCHEIGEDDGGAAEGPAFRTLAMRYNALSLQRRFAEVSAHGFDRMPPITFTKAEADDLSAYLGTLHAH